MTLLNIYNLTVHRTVDDEAIIKGVNLSVSAGEVVGIVGESGSGKSVTGLALLGLLPNGLTSQGSITLNGEELLTRTQKEWECIRGNRIAMVLQDPSSSLHPTIKIGKQLTDHQRTHLGVSKDEAQTRAIEMLDRVHLKNPTAILESYPHQLSGGMKQRVAIAIALACDPELLIADEPTTALDANIRTEIIALLDELRQETQMGILFITHDLALLSSFANRVSVFRHGEIMETGDANTMLITPDHAYTQQLLDAVPRIPWSIPEATA